MFDFDWLQWPAMAVTLAAAWCVASTQRRRREAGFWLFLASNVLWGAFNFLVSALLLWAIAGSLGQPLAWVLLALAGVGFGVVTAHIFSHPPATPRGRR